jgi:hypothetical protein
MKPGFHYPLAEWNPAFTSLGLGLELELRLRLRLELRLT